MAGKSNANATNPTVKKVMTLDEVMDMGKLRINAIIEPAVNNVTGLPTVEKAQNNEVVEGNITYNIYERKEDGSKGRLLITDCRFPVFTSGGVGAGSRTKLPAEPNSPQAYKRVERNLDRFKPTVDFGEGVVKAYKWMMRAKVMLSAVGASASNAEMLDDNIILTVGKRLDDLIS